MQRFQDNRRPGGRPALQGLTTAALAFCCVFALVLVNFVISHRSVAELISDAVEAEFAAAIESTATTSPEIAQTPKAIQTARRN